MLFLGAGRIAQPRIAGQGGTVRGLLRNLEAEDGYEFAVVEAESA
jgi:hypothetical protein